MSSLKPNNTPFNLVFSPLVYSPFVKYSPDAVIAPSGSEFITSEDSLKLTAENGELLVTEG